jgi:hypothetical protein
MRRLLILALAPLLTLGACGDPKQSPSSPEAPAPSGAAASTTPSSATSSASAAIFQHDAKLDAFGYYFSDPPIRSGPWELSSLNIGTPEDFAAWEQGKRPTTYAPIFLEFEDVTSPTAENELGQTYHTVSFRLLPEVYRVDGEAVVFRAKDKRLGDVVFSGAFDLEALKRAKASDPTDEDLIVLRGDLQLGAARLGSIRFTYFAGD